MIKCLKFVGTYDPVGFLIFKLCLVHLKYMHSPLLELYTVYLLSQTLKLRLLKICIITGFVCVLFWWQGGWPD